MKEVTSDALDIDRASAWVRVYDRVKPEVLVNVNLSLRTMLDGIKHYREPANGVVHLIVSDGSVIA
jgi:hypothetical protein